MSNVIDKIRLSGTDYTLSATSSGVSVVEVTQAEYDALPSSSKTDTSKMYVITDAEAGDLTNYYTKTETNTLLGGKADTATTYSKSEVDTALSGKQDTLVSGTNIKTINNTSILGSGNIDIQGGSGGGKAVSAGRGISVTTGETADTVSFNLPMSADTIGLAFFDSKDGGEISSGNSINKNNLVLSGLYNKIGGNGSKRVFSGNFISGWGSKIFDNTWAYDYGATYNIIFGSYNTLSGNGKTVNSSIIVGDYCYGYAENQSLFGYYLQAQNNSEHSIGQNNVSNKANTTFGDSGNTLFSVGNGINENARHNAFEIRQNGDIYLTKDGQDVKLQDQLGGSGGGKAVSAGRGISVTTGETAYTISVSLPISAGTGTNSIKENNATSANGNYSHSEGFWTRANGLESHAEGYSTIASGESTHAEGSSTQANGISSHAEGASTKANGDYSHTEGNRTKANNQSEHASGQYNVSSSASTTFGDGGNTLFSVGNGTADNARHNAFEIRQNGDIYLTLNGQDVKLQDILTQLLGS